MLQRDTKLEKCVSDPNRSAFTAKSPVEMNCRLRGKGRKGEDRQEMGGSDPLVMRPSEKRRKAPRFAQSAEPFESDGVMIPPEPGDVRRSTRQAGPRDFHWPVDR